MRGPAIDGGPEADSRPPRLPTFLVIGALKAGTTSLYQYLRSHPRVFMPELKEPAFFRADGAGTWHRGVSWYGTLFAGAGGAVAVGEASPGYTMHPYSPGVPERIRAVVPQARLVYLVRHPIERMVSQYQMRVVNGRERLPMAEALLSNPAYVDVSNYAMQIEQYLEHFPRERLLVVRSEDLRDDRAATMRRVFGFLGVDPAWKVPDLERSFNTAEARRVRRGVGRALRRLPGYQRVGASAPAALRRVSYRLTTRRVDEPEPLQDGVVGELEDRLREPVRRLCDYLGPDFDGWGIG